MEAVVVDFEVGSVGAHFEAGLGKPLAVDMVSWSGQGFQRGTDVGEDGIFAAGYVATEVMPRGIWVVSETAAPAEVAHFVRDGISSLAR